MESAPPPPGSGVGGGQVLLRTSQGRRNNMIWYIHIYQCKMSNTRKPKRMWVAGGGGGGVQSKKPKLLVKFTNDCFFMEYLTIILGSKYTF